MAATRSINPATFSANPFVQALVSERVWTAGDLITYYLKPTDLNGNGSNDLTEKGAAAAIVDGYAAWAAVANIRVQQVANPADAVWIEQAVTGSGGASHTLPYVRPLSSEAGGNYKLLAVDSAQFAKGGQWYTIALHEIGHGLGLEHTHDSGRFPGVPAGDDDAAGDYGLNSRLYSVMSYNSVTNFTYGTPATPMAFDIAAVQALYGANMATATGSDSYVLPTANAPGTWYACIWDAAGVDTITVGAGATTGAAIDLRAATLRDEAGGGGFLSSVNGIKGGFTIANGVVIENAIGSAFADTIVGNDAANRLDGGKGVDTLTGGLGDDTYVVDRSEDMIVESDGQGADTVLTDAAVYELPLGISVEAVRALDPASTAAQAFRGNFGDQLIVGNAGANILNGYGGADTLAGLGGNDTYLVRGPGDRVLENNGEGIDTVYTTVSYNLGANEVETLSTVVQADTVTIDLIGNYATQLVIGNYGNNILNGGVGGDDTLIGLRGDDTYAVGSQSIAVVENPGEGADTLVTSVDYRLAAGSSIETFAAQNREAAVGLRLTGNEVAQVVAGTNRADVLDGRGGADTLYGLGGDDLFVLSAAPGAGNVDVLADFGAGADRIGLASDVFSAIGAKLDATEFVLGGAAQDADDRILYDLASGRLFYDADGSGAAAAVQIAQLAAGTALSSDRFDIVAPVLGG